MSIVTHIFMSVAILAQDLSLKNFLLLLDFPRARHVRPLRLAGCLFVSRLFREPGCREQQDHSLQGCRGRQFVPDIIKERNCNNRTNCPHFHPDFINDHWVVPDFICHKWFQGICEYPNSCWNQHGKTFDSAFRPAFHIQLSSRGRYPPVQFRSDEGGTMRQINRRDAERLIMHTMGDFRRREVRKWRFGTHFTEFHDYEKWDQSIDADRVRSEYQRAQEVARMNDVPRARSPRTARRLSPSGTLPDADGSASQSFDQALGRSPTPSASTIGTGSAVRY